MLSEGERPVSAGSSYDFQQMPVYNAMSWAARSAPKAGVTPNGTRGGSVSELYDESRDPRELNNLAGNSDFASMQAEMKLLLGVRDPE